MKAFQPVFYPRRKHYPVRTIEEVCMSGDAPYLIRLLKAGASANQKIGDKVNLLFFPLNPEIYKILLAHKADVNAKDDEDMTPLDYAVKRGDLDAAEIFIFHGANVNNVCKFRDTPLIFAARTGNTAMTLFLIKSGADIDARNLAGCNAYDSAMIRYFDNLVGYLRPTNTPVPSTPDIVDAARKGILVDVEYYLEKSPSIQLKQAALRAAVISHYPRTVKALLATSIPVDQDLGNLMGRSTISMISVVLAKIKPEEVSHVLAGAIMNGFNNIEAIIRRGHSPDMPICGVPALVYAYLNGRVSAFCTLLTLGARPFDSFPSRYSNLLTIDKYILPNSRIILPESRNKIADHSMFVANRKAQANKK